MQGTDHNTNFYSSEREEPIQFCSNETAVRVADPTVACSNKFHRHPQPACMSPLKPMNIPVSISLPIQMGPTYSSFDLVPFISSFSYSLHGRKASRLQQQDGCSKAPSSAHASTMILRSLYFQSE